MKNNNKLKYGFILTSTSILSISMINKIIFKLSTIKETLYSKNSNYYSWRFGKTFYTIQGEGSPILLIHELNPNSSDTEWKRITDKLSRKHTVYTIDLLGCGRSDKPKIIYTTYLYVQLIHDFIKNVIKNKTNIIATSTSSNIAIMSCYLDNTLFDKILLINPESFSSFKRIPTFKLKALKHILNLPILGTFIYNIITSKFYIKKLFKNKYYYLKRNIKTKYINYYNEASHLNGANARFLYSSIKTNYTKTNSINALKSINNSIYIIMGQYEKYANKTISEYTNTNLAIEYSIIKNSAHLPQLEQPEKILSICDIFF